MRIQTLFVILTVRSTRAIFEENFLKKTIKLAIGALCLLLSLAAANYFLGWFSAEDLRQWSLEMREDPWLLALAIVGLLSIDSLLSIPTIATGIAAGYLLGPVMGGAATAVGVLSAGSLCYWSARLTGKSGFVSQDTLDDIRGTIGDVGPVPLMISRAAPMMPEVLSILAGVGSMPVRKYYLYFALGNVPIAFALAFAGSVSSIDSPLPAVLAGVAPATLGATVLAVRRRLRQTSATT